MIRLRRRATRHISTGIPLDERHVAVGALTGLPPSGITGYVLIALPDGNSGDIRLSTDMHSLHEVTATLVTALKIAVLDLADHAAREETR